MAVDAFMSLNCRSVYAQNTVLMIYALDLFINTSNSTDIHDLAWRCMFVLLGCTSSVDCKSIDERKWIDPVIFFIITRSIELDTLFS